MIKFARPEAYELFHAGTLALSEMESQGFRVDMDFLDGKMDEINATIKAIEEELKQDKVYAVWRRTFGDKTKLNAREQLARVLYDKMGFEYKGERTAKSGKYRTDEAAFDELDHPFVKKYVRLNKLKKIRAPYLTGLKREAVQHEDGLWYVHPVMNLHLVNTYRSSCDTPNLQNVPTRIPELAEMIRRCFIPRPGCRIIEIDFKSVEVSIAACYHKDPTMIKYLETGYDMHKDMACECYMLKSEQVHKQSRYCAKNMFVFPQFYGSYYLDCARHLWEAIDRLKLVTADGGVPLKQHLAKKGITELGDQDEGEKPRKGTFEHHIKQVEDRFWNERFPVYTQWKKDWYDAYLRAGGFYMLTGFRVEGNLRRNQVINFPVQGSAFHCALWCICRILKKLKKYKMKSRLVLQVHDSLVGDVPEKETQDYIEIAIKVITRDLPKAFPWINIPVGAEVEGCDVGADWFTKKGWELKNGLWQLGA